MSGGTVSTRGHGGRRQGSGWKRPANPDAWKLPVSGKVPRHLKEALAREATKSGLSVSALLESILMDRYVGHDTESVESLDMAKIEGRAKAAIEKMEPIRNKQKWFSDVVAALSEIHMISARVAGGRLPGERVHPKADTPTEGTKEVILGFVQRVQPEAGAGALVPLRALRYAAGMTNDRGFDAAIMQLANDGRVWLHRHVHPYRLKETDKKELVTDGAGNYYVGLVIRE